MKNYIKNYYYLLVDCSYSMECYIPIIKNQLQKHLQNIENYQIEHQNPEIELNLITFNFQIIDRLYKTNKSKVLQTLSKIETIGQSAFFDAIGESLHLIEERLNTDPSLIDHPAKITILVFSDGKDNCSEQFKAVQVNELFNKTKASLRENQMLNCIILGGASPVLQAMKIIDLDEDFENKYLEELANSFYYIERLLIQGFNV
jgi:hypothetical protein